MTTAIGLTLLLFATSESILLCQRFPRMEYDFSRSRFFILITNVVWPTFAGCWLFIMK